MKITDGLETGDTSDCSDPREVAEEEVLWT